MEDITYHLPQELIAQSPAEPRDVSQLLVMDPQTGAVSHHHFFDLPSLLRPGDVLVRNRSRVIPARLQGTKVTGGKVEVFLLKCVDKDNNEWQCLCKPGLNPKQTLIFDTNVFGEITGHVQNDIVHYIRFNTAYEHFLFQLENIGSTPLPPYIDSDQTSDFVRRRYQTTYAREAGSVAAPTAGLHFTEELDSALRKRGVTIEEVVLHVGLGTFAPVREHDVTQHEMHGEWFSLDDATAARLNAAKTTGRRIIAVGTTTIRVLETCAAIAADGSSTLIPQTGETKIYIYPPYQFKFVDGLITNFHLPKSTLLLLVSAFTSAPNTTHDFTNFADSPIGHAYATAIQEHYRFFSFGDGMLISA